MPLSQRGMRGAQPLKQAVMGGSLATPTAPQRTDVSPNRCGEPVSRPKETLALQGGEEVRSSSLVIGHQPLFNYIYKTYYLIFKNCIQKTLNNFSRNILSSAKSPLTSSPP
uniref:Uncharacterized protein n=1 Tax=Fervidicoccus fontis TaxID=683846 RepID=A0A7C1E2T4_9CREN